MLGCRGWAVLVLLLSGSLVGSGDTPDSAFAIGVPNGGPWGAWAWQEMCPKGTYATGFSLKVEPYQGSAKDDTGLNGVRLLCTRGGRGDRHEAHAVESQSGRGGRWSGAVWCPPGGCLPSFSLRVEPVQIGLQDNMGATNIRFACSGGETLQGHGLSWGEYGVWSPPCEKGLCGSRQNRSPHEGC